MAVCSQIRYPARLVVAPNEIYREQMCISIETGLQDALTALVNADLLHRILLQDLVPASLADIVLAVAGRYDALVASLISGMVHAL